MKFLAYLRAWVTITARPRFCVKCDRALWYWERHGQHPEWIVP